MRVWVMHNDCAKIIGKGGSTLRMIEARSRTKMKVQKEGEMDSEVKERHVEIIGTKSEQQAAVELLLEQTRFCRDDEGKVLKDVRDGEGGDLKAEPPLVLEILPEEVGRILGRKGETVQLLEKGSRTKIEVGKETGRVEIFGKPESHARAIELILEEVSFAKSEEGTILKETQRAIKAEGEEAAEEPPPLLIWVTDREAGKVIGRGGETVREIMDGSGADVKVQKSDNLKPGTTEREVRIFGSKEQQDKALEAVLKEVTWARGPDGMLKTPPEPEPRPPREERPPPPAPRRPPPPRGGTPQHERERAREAREEAASGREPAVRDKPRGGLWVCGTCGGDHRTKDCPHSTGLLGVGMQLGMQMGLQAMGMQGLHMGMQMGMGGPMMPMLPGMPGMPGMMPLRPGMQPRGRGGDSESSGSSSSGAEDSQASSAPRGRRARAATAGRGGAMPEAKQELLDGVPSGGAADGRERRRKRRRATSPSPAAQASRNNSARDGRGASLSPGRPGSKTARRKRSKRRIDMADF